MSWIHPKVLEVGRKWLPRPVVNRLHPFIWRVDQFIQRAAEKLPPGARVLDSGAGESRYRSLFGQHRYVALDHAETGSGFDFSRLDVCADLAHLPFSAGSFDAVLNVFVLEHLPDPLGALREVAGVLRPGGRLFCAAPQSWEYHPYPADYFRFTSQGLSLLAHRAGLRVVHSEPVGGYFWLLGLRSFYLLHFLQGGWKYLIFAVLAPFYGVLVPLACYYLDRFDREKLHTLGHLMICERPE